MRKALDLIALTAGLLTAVSGFILIRHNLPAFSPVLPSLLLWGIYFLLFPLTGFFNLTRDPVHADAGSGFVLRIARALLFFAAAAALPVMFVRSALIDYYQPFALYDGPIYIMLVSWVLFLLLFLFLGLRSLAGRYVRQGLLLWPMLLLLLVPVVVVFGGLSTPDWRDVITGTEDLYRGGDEGYRSYRIPGLLAVPAGSRLADGTVCGDDVLLAFAEARREGSVDQGDIDLVLRRSDDAGRTWSGMEVVRRWEDGRGKIGDPTPLFDASRGIIVLAMGAQAQGEPYETWLMESGDGGLTWSEPRRLGGGSPGPGHGTSVLGGPADGRLIIPAHVGNDGFAWLSHAGRSWRRSAGGYIGNESLMAGIGDGRVVYTARVPRSVARPHPRMNKLFGISPDGGETWEEYPSSGVVTPICMSGFVADDSGVLWFVNPATVRTRARLSLRRSEDDGRSWSEPLLLLPGPAGYADLAAGPDGDLYVLAENGRVEYDERITFARITAPPGR